MATIKSFTSLEQAKRLAEFLPLESADMYYGYRKDKPEFLPMSDEDVKCLSQPCWSLTALRSLLPVGIKINENTYLFESHNTFNKSWVYRYYNEDDTSYIYYNNTNEVDACYEMTIRLHELNLL